jgi:predicted permease
VQSLLQDLRYALRQLWNNRGFTVLVVLTISLGIGANVAIFSMENGLHRPLPVRDPDQLVVIAAQTKGDQTGFQFRYSFAAMRDLRNQADCFSDLFAFRTDLTGIDINGRASQFLYSAVTGNYFSALGLQPVLGRFFAPGEGETPGSDYAIVLSYRFWQEHFSGDRGVIGRQVRLNGITAQIVGVAPSSFHGTYTGVAMDGYMPLNGTIRSTDPNHTLFFTDRTIRALTLLGRLKPGVSFKQAQGVMDVLARRMEQEHPESDRGIGARVIPEVWARPVPLGVLADLLPIVRGFLLALAGVVLLLACMNVANILLVRATTRQREMAIRAALGSGRARLIQQALTESCLLALLGAAGGLALGKLGSAAFVSSIDLASDLPVLVDFSFDWNVFSYALAAAAITGLAIGLWPALKASRADAGSALHDGSRGETGGPQRQRVRGALVVGQVAGSLVLLIVAGLFVRSLRNAEHVDLGFNAENVLNARMDPSWVGYDEQRSRDFYRELKRRVSSLPGVESVTMAFSVPMGYYADGRTVAIDGRPVNPDQQLPGIGCNHVDPDYFTTMKMPIVEGRAFNDADVDGARKVAIVNQTMANTYWPGQDPIGKIFRLPGQDEKPWQVVGVAKNSKYIAVFESPQSYFYIPMDQAFIPLHNLQIRSSVPPETLAPLVRNQIQQLDPEIAVSDLQSMRRSLSGVGGFAIFRLGASQGGAMGLLGFLLAVIGVYGVVSYGAAQRTREIGIRMALGAEPWDVLRLVLGQGVYLVIGGVLVGLVGAFALTRVLSKFLLLASATDPLTFFIVTLTLMLIALAACYIPARRATLVAPTVALRHE